MIIGVTGIVGYSYKMSRSRVYPVGIVRRSAIRIDETSGRRSDSDVLEFWSATAANNAIATDYMEYLSRKARTRKRHRTVEEVKSMRSRLGVTVWDYGVEGISLKATGTQLWRCPNCGIAQPREKDLRCVRCAYVPEPVAAKGIGNPEELGAKEPSSLQTQVAQYGRALQDFEERIRKLERDSVVQKIDEERGMRVGQSDWVH